jgi:hypothetical protein
MKRKRQKVSVYSPLEAVLLEMCSKPVTGTALAISYTSILKIIPVGK